MIVYIVTQGEYSDYSIQGICSTPELAEELCQKLRRADKPWLSRADQPAVEEWTLDERKEDQVREIYRTYIDLNSGDCFNPSIIMDLTAPLFSAVHGAREERGRLVMFVSAAGSMERCQKIAAEARQGYLREHAHETGTISPGDSTR